MYVGTTTDTYIPESCARALFKLCGHVCVLLLYLAVCVWNHLVCAILSFAVLDPSVQKHIQCTYVTFFQQGSQCKKKNPTITFFQQGIQCKKKDPLLDFEKRSGWHARDVRWGWVKIFINFFFLSFRDTFFSLPCGRLCTYVCMFSSFLSLNRSTIALLTLRLFSLPTTTVNCSFGRVCGGV